LAGDFVELLDIFMRFGGFCHRKDPSYRMAEGVVLKTDPSTHPPTHPSTYPLSNHWSDLIQILNLALSNQSVRILQMKMTSHGRGPQNIKSGISQMDISGYYILYCKNSLNEDDDLSNSSLHIGS
jgi:hypothetical protein